MNMAVKAITSKDNPVLKRIRASIKDNSGYKSDQTIWIEGDHLCSSAIHCGIQFTELLLLDTATESDLIFWSKHASQIYTLPESLFSALSQLPSATPIVGSIVVPSAQQINRSESIIVLDEVQDPGNAGSILRCAAAFGYKQIVTTHGSVSLWSPKVVRSGMGAHFGLKLFESMEISQLVQLSLPVMLTDSHRGVFLHEMTRQRSIPDTCLWVFGHEGRGVNQKWLDSKVNVVRINQPGGQESLNVAAAAAICLHAHASQKT